ncbi:methyltransferase [Nocardia sp. NPDC050712]|uniref:methyltransferase n=1 Tax=Nocardia sp. NPDC050712 TaxID=3155518 RepID=UPI0033CB3A80
MNDHHAATLRSMAGLATPMAIRVAVTLGLPDRLRGNGATTEQVAAELELSATALELLLGHLTMLDILERADNLYRTTVFGSALCGDAGNGLTNFLHLDLAGGRAELAFTELLHSVTTGTAGYARRYGQDFWADLTRNPHLRASFDQQMTDRFRDQIPRIVAAYDWSRYSTLVDVGGGHGTLLAAVLTANPGLRGHLIDLDPTASEARHTFAAHGVADRVQVTAASFFDPIPEGAQAYLLCDILHDWNDAHAHLILARCVRALPPTGRLLIIEPVGGRHAGTEFDLAMLVIFGGRERRLDEFRALTAPHGLTLESVTDLTEQRCLLEFRRMPGD